ncbi:extracellular matrix glycoprotein pherophorin-V31 [Volvox carteri f. nagariensis]|uniref:Extracellular matrix glycoprotein pherophorin-V31 n=1 Tax=Volvox carteri f. nagariensis TaxID=3068 RepID=D8TRL6_VOLCA|nr:extracellular matrix glycoprotein pherophorin-V31 [Volvox carteri f. nagariensis]EFJ49915.1 extracellular matrix glycoprotein pherophorin-V31 [Volvox carteri f. nagariensis]|eukprot:XP_002948980.1 extracellular matrix glycoprotein pherophorin-V31 [Volvox carteri f. nagariensis]
MTGCLRRAAGALLLLAGCLSLVPAGWALDVDYTPETTAEALATFPYCKCNDYRTRASPYRLRLSGASKNTAGTLAKICYTIDMPGCYDDTNECCKLIYQRLEKIELEVKSACQKDVKQPPQSTCDCLSPFIDNHSRWRFRFQESEVVGNLTVFIFTLSVDPSSQCIPVTYRAGDCCNQAMDGVSLALQPSYSGLVHYAKVYTYDGMEIGVKTGHTAYGGLGITLPKVLYTTDIPSGQFYTFEIAFSTSNWADTTKLPCRVSAFTPGLPSCDYSIHGWQTVPGNPSAILPPNELTAGCCPEGIVSFCSERINSTCNPRLTDSPFRLNYVNTSQEPAITETTLSFQISAQPVTNPLGPQEGLPDCSGMTLQSVKMYMADTAVAAVKGIVLSSGVLSYSVGKDATGAYVDVEVPSSRSGLGRLLIVLSGLFNQTDVCAYKVGQYSVCNYVFKGASGSCCAMGDVPVATTQRSIVTYG